MTDPTPPEAGVMGPAATRTVWGETGAFEEVPTIRGPVGVAAAMAPNRKEETRIRLTNSTTDAPRAEASWGRPTSRARSGKSVASVKSHRDPSPHLR